MPLRFVLAALSALLTPPGVQGEVGCELELLLEEDRPRAQQPALAAGPGPERPQDGVRTATAPEGSGTTGSPATLSPSTPWTPAPAYAGPELPISRHLARCGHDASTLDLPPPPRA